MIHHRRAMVGPCFGLDTRAFQTLPLQGIDVQAMQIIQVLFPIASPKHNNLTARREKIARVHVARTGRVTKDGRLHPLHICYVDIVHVARCKGPRAQPPANDKELALC